MPHPYIFTVKALQRHTERYSTLRLACNSLGLDESMAPTLSRILRGESIGRRKESRVRRSLGLWDSIHEVPRGQLKELVHEVLGR